MNIGSIHPMGFERFPYRPYELAIRCDDFQLFFVTGLESPHSQACGLYGPRSLHSPLLSTLVSR